MIEFNPVTMNNRIEQYDPPLDAGIKNAVETLRAHGIETFESCEGGPNHAYAEPTIRFHGDYAEGFKALSIALRAGLSVLTVRRTWVVQFGEPTGPWWEITFKSRQEPVGNRVS